VLGDALDEGNETFTLDATAVSGATPATLTATGTITDDDVAPALSIDNGGCSATEADSTAVNCAFAFRLSAPSGRAVTFATSTLAGTAASGVDYTAHTNVTRTIAAGQTTLTVNVPVLGDLLDEPDETFTLDVDTVVNATPATLTATATIVDDDAAPTLSVDNGGCSATEADSTAVNCAFVFRLSAASGYAVTFNTATANGTATAADYTGHAATARTIAAGATSLTVNVPVLGDLLDEANETFTLAATGIAHATPTTLAATGTINDDDAPPALSIENGGCSTTEAAGCDFVLRLSAPSGLPVTFNTATAAGTATSGTDFTAHAATARTIAAGQTTLTVTVPTLGDAIDEANETFALNVTAVANATPATLSGTGTIIDDDGVPTVSISDCSATETDAGTTPCTFTVSLSNASSAAVSVAYATANGTAASIEDYASASGTLSFAAGETSKPLAVGVVGDTRNELSEAFTVTLSAPANATLGDASGTGTITDDDPLPALSLTGCSATEGDAGTTPCTFAVALSAASGRTVTVAYASTDATAVAPGDYAAVGGTLTFAPGERSKNIVANVAGELVDENNETFTVTLATPVGATLATASATGTIVDDDGPAGQIRMASCHVVASEVRASVTLQVQRVNGGTGAVSVTWATGDVEAIDGQDYTGGSGTLNWASGDTAPKSITVPILASAAVEPDETFELALGAPTGGANLAQPSYSQIRIFDGEVLFRDGDEDLRNCVE
jgi:hypothetical protein